MSLGFGIRNTLKIYLKYPDLIRVQATNGKVAAGRTTRNKPAVTDISSTSLDGSTSSSSSLSGANGNNNGVNTGSNGAGLSGSKDENTAGGAGKAAAPSEEQRTMKTRSAK